MSDRVFNAITSFPEWLESFDALHLPAWAVLLSVGIGLTGFIFAVREFLSWFLKTNSIVDEVLRLENLVRDLQGDLAALEGTVAKLQATASSSDEPVMTTDPKFVAASTSSESESASRSRQFRLDN